MKNIVLKLEKMFLLKKIKLYLNYIKNYNLDKITNFNEMTKKLKDKELLNITDKLIKYLKINNATKQKLLIIYLLKNFSDNLIEKRNIIDNHMLYWCDEIINIINNNQNINLDKLLIIFEKYFNIANYWLLMDKNRLIETTLFSLKENKDLINKLKISNIEEKDILINNAINNQDLLLNNLKSLNIFDISMNSSMNSSINILDNIDNIISDYTSQYKQITISIKYNYLLVFVKKLKEEIKKDNREIIYLNLLEINKNIKSKNMRRINMKSINDYELKEIVLDDKLLLEYLIKLSNLFKLNIIFDKPENYIPEIIIKINHFL